MTTTTLDMAVAIASEFSDEIRERIGTKLIEQLEKSDPVLGGFLTRLESDPAFAAHIDAALEKGESDIEAGSVVSIDTLTPEVIRQRITTSNA